MEGSTGQHRPGKKQGKKPWKDTYQGPRVQDMPNGAKEGQHGHSKLMNAAAENKYSGTIQEKIAKYDKPPKEEVKQPKDAQSKASMTNCQPVAGILGYFMPSTIGYTKAFELMSQYIEQYPINKQLMTSGVSQKAIICAIMLATLQQWMQHYKGHSLHYGFSTIPIYLPQKLVDTIRLFGPIRDDSQGTFEALELPQFLRWLVKEIHGQLQQRDFSVESDDWFDTFESGAFTFEQGVARMAGKYVTGKGGYIATGEKVNPPGTAFMTIEAQKAMFQELLIQCQEVRKAFDCVKFTPSTSGSHVQCVTSHGYTIYPLAEGITSLGVQLGITSHIQPGDGYVIAQNKSRDQMLESFHSASMR